MSGLPWLKLSADHLDHPKAVALRDRLEDPRAPLHLAAGWCYVARWYPVGSIPDNPTAIQAFERAVLWQGAAGELVAAMVEVGLLERRRGRIAVHGWDEWQGKHIEKFERDRQRMRAKRAEDRRNGRADSGDGSHDGRGEEERRGEQKREETPLPPRVARLGVAHPAFEAAEHWTKTVWPLVAKTPALPITTAQAQRLALLSGQLGPAEVKARMDRAAADAWWRERLTLDAFLDSPDRWAARTGGARAAKAPAPPSTDFTEVL